jgi:hypothetical protein
MNTLADCLLTSTVKKELACNITQTVLASVVLMASAEMFAGRGSALKSGAFADPLVTRS